MKLIEALDQLINVCSPKEIVLNELELAELMMQILQKYPLTPYTGFTKGFLTIYRGVTLTKYKQLDLTEVYKKKVS